MLRVGLGKPPGDFGVQSWQKTIARRHPENAFAADWRGPVTPSFTRGGAFQSNIIRPSCALCWISSHGDPSRDSLIGDCSQVTGNPAAKRAPRGPA